MSRKRSVRSSPVPVNSQERLQKALAAAGVGSRRHCEELIVQGRVEVDRRVIDELGTRVDPRRQEIRVDGTVLPRPKLAYYLVNKPVGVVCTNSDPSGRTRVVDLVPTDERLYTVGRLDRTSEGLILVTNDGELANLLTHPRYGVKKVYRAFVAGHPAPALLSRLRQGIHLAEGVAQVSAVRVRRKTRDGCELQVVLQEGRNREIRRLLARVGHKVRRLKRVAMGPLSLGQMPSGAYRRLSPQEIRRLKDSCREARRRQAHRGARPSGEGSRGSAPPRRAKPASSRRTKDVAGTPRRRRTVRGKQR